MTYCHHNPCLQAGTRSDLMAMVPRGEDARRILGAEKKIEENKHSPDGYTMNYDTIEKR